MMSCLQVDCGMSTRIGASVGMNDKEVIISKNKIGYSHKANSDGCWSGDNTEQTQHCLIKIDVLE